MVCLYGMSEKLGAVAFATAGAPGYASTFGEPAPSVNPEVAWAIDEEVRELLAQARRRARPGGMVRRHVAGPRPPNCTPNWPVG